MKLSQWMADEEKQEKFRKLINNPILQEALALVREDCIPATRSADNPEHMLTLYALDHARAAGWFAALSMLEGLQKVSPSTVKVFPQSWKYKETETKPK